MLRIRAGSVHPVTAPPISDGAVLVDDTGKIAAVGPHPRVPTPPGARTLEFPDAALVGRGIAYHEVFGPDPARCAASIAELEQALGWLSRFASSHLRLGVSPHAPYTVSEPLYRAVADFARREGLPVAVHLAESREEVQLVREGSGPFAEALRARGVAVEPRGLTPAGDYLQLCGLAACGRLCI